MHKAVLAAILAFVASSSASVLSIKRDEFAKCGITDDAVLSDCQTLIEDDATWNANWVGDSKTCTYSNVVSDKLDAKASNVACYQGCCIYVAQSADKDTSQIPATNKDQTRVYADKALGCADTSANKVNGQYGDPYFRVCLSDGEGCGDCFDDSGEAPL